MRWDGRFLSQIDWSVFLFLAGLVGVGMTVISSAAHTMPGGATGFLVRQGAAVFLGLVVGALMMAYEYRDLGRWSTEIYVAILLMLAAVMVTGHTALGAQRWIKLGPIQIQPSEPAKVLLVIALAHFLSKRESLTSWWDLILPGAYVALPIGLVLLQPDLGTALVFIFLTFAMLYMAGVPGWRVALVLLGGIGAVVLWVFAHKHWGIWIPLKDYQINRLIVFLNPNAFPDTFGYHVIQSRIAIGSGGLLGKGYMQGTQNQLSFLPESHTDFIFAVLCEEFGFVGGITVLVLSICLLWRLMRSCVAVEDKFGRLLITGIVTMLAFQVIENVGMTLGVMPVAGIPLPFVSYGPSAMVTNMWAIGLAIGVAMRRKSIIF